MLILKQNWGINYIVMCMCPCMPAATCILSTILPTASSIWALKGVVKDTVCFNLWALKLGSDKDIVFFSLCNISSNCMRVWRPAFGNCTAHYVFPVSGFCFFQLCCRERFV